MMQYESILAFGDSNVAGAEAVPHAQDLHRGVIQGQLTIHDVDAVTKPYSFANQLAALMGIPCHNFAMSGGSNDRSLRLLTQHIREHPRSLVLFGYTSTDRKEFYYPDAGVFYARDSDQFIQTGIHWRLHTGTLPAHPINEVFVEKILRPYNNLAQVMMCVAAVCRQHTRGVLHLPLMPEQIPQGIDSVFDFQGQGNWWAWAQHQGYAHTARFHFDHTAHRALAELLHQHLVGSEH